MAASTQAPSPRPGRVALRNSRAAWLIATVPAVVLLGAIILLPLGQSLLTSVTDPALGIGNYVQFFQSEAFVRILLRTFWAAIVVTVLCLLLAYPYAYLMTLVGRKLRGVMTATVLVPFWTSSVVRTFSWLVVLQPKGLLNNGLSALGLPALDVLGTQTAVILAMTHVMLPMMVLPLFSTMSGTDRSLLRAAASMGAGPFRAFWKAYLPLTRPGIVAGCVVVFVSSLGFYLVPQILGSPREMLLSQLIFEQISTLLNFGLGAAMGVVLLVVTLVVLGFSARAGGSVDANYGTRAVLNDGGTRLQQKPILLGIYAILVSAFLTLPTLVVIPLSLNDAKSFVLPAENYSLRWYENFFTNPSWTSSFSASVEIALITTVLATTIGVLASFGIVRSRSGFGRALHSFIMIPRSVPAIVIGIAIYAVFLQWGLSGTPIGFILAHTSLALPFVVISVTAGLQTLDVRLETAAASLGAGAWNRFRKVILPLIAPSVLSGALFAFITSFDEVLVSLFLQSPFLRTLPLKMFSSIQDQIDPTIAAAASIIFIVATALVLLGTISRKKASHNAVLH